MMTNQKLARRYRSGYWAGKLINGVGIIIMLAGLLLAVVIAATTVRVNEVMIQHPKAMEWVQSQLEIAISQQYLIVNSIGLALGVTIFLLLWTFGTFVSAVAQILKALLDTAVNTSPLLSIEEKQKVIR